MTSRRIRVASKVVGGCMLAALLAVVSCGGDAPPPNLVLISIDTLRADRLNTYGYDLRTVSPHIDALAADGILFENAITTSPWTTPAHVSLLTSLQPTSHGVVTPFADLREGLKGGGRFIRLPDSRTTLAEVLRDAGFATAAFTGGVTLDPRIGFDQGFEQYDTSMKKLGPASVGTLIEWIEGRAGHPFFLFWHTFEVHAPYLDTTFLGDALPPETTKVVKDALAERARLFEERRAPGYGLRKILVAHGVFNREVLDALYMGGVSSVDRRVGELVERLRSADLYDPTLIVLTSDHGEELGQRSESQKYDAHGHTLYEELVRVPLIVKLPGGRHAGTRVRSVTSLLDVMPTILDVLGISPPRDEMQGESLRPRWEQPGTSEGQVAFAEALGVGEEKKALRADRYKYILSMDADTVARLGRDHVPEEPAAAELYDLQADPEERVNLLEGLGGRGYARSPLVMKLDADLRAFAAREAGETESVDLPSETIEGLKALGYIE